MSTEPARGVEWEALREQWLADYQPENATGKQTVLRAAEADWQLRLEEERYHQAESKLMDEQGDPLDWTPEQHKRLQIFERRLDRAQRILLRFQRVAEQLRRTRFTETLRLETHGWRREAHQLAMQIKQNALQAEEDAKPAPLPKFVPGPYVQWVEVTVEEGVTVTTMNPSQFGMVGAIDQLSKPGDRVKRTLHLPNPLPPEYDWARTPDGTPVFFMSWMCSVEEFREDMKRDLVEDNGHIVRSPHMPLTVDQEKDARQ